MTAPLPPGPADVTDADRAKARDLRQRFLTLAETPPGMEEAIAAALAAERAAVARPVLALADGLRARIAAAARAHRRKKDHLCSCGWVDLSVPLSVTWEQHLADVALAGPDDTQQDGAR